MSKKTKYQKKGEMKAPMPGTISSVDLNEIDFGKVYDNIVNYFRGSDKPEPKPKPMSEDEKFKIELMNKFNPNNIINPGVPTNNTPLYIKAVGGAMNYKGPDYSKVKNKPKKSY